MGATIDVDELVAEINRHLPVEQQIQKSDPMYAGVVINKFVLACHVDCVQKNLAEALRQLSVASDQQIDKATVISEKLITNAGHHIEQQVEVLARQWEGRLRNAGSDGEASIRRACRLAWTGAILIFVCACIVIGSYMGTFAFDVLHHAKQRHR